MSEPRDKKGLTEAEFLRQYRADKYEKPALTADVVIFRKGAGGPEVLLIRRGGHPFLGFWALPGGFAEKNETLEASAARELQEETCVTGAGMRLVGVYSTPGRDPRGWTVSAAFTALVPAGTAAAAADDAAELRWFPLEAAPDGLWRLSDPAELAFDHGQILADAIRMMCAEL